MPNGTRVHGCAADLDDFTRQVATVDGDALKAQLRAGDLSRWASEVVADAELTSRLRSIERWVRNEPGMSRTQAREAVISAVESRYDHRNARRSHRSIAASPG